MQPKGQQTNDIQKHKITIEELLNVDILESKVFSFTTHQQQT